MLFYLKKHVLLEMAVAVVLGMGGWMGLRAFSVPVGVRVTPAAVLAGMAGALALTMWTLLVQTGYALTKGHDYAEGLTAALASHFTDARASQVLAALFAAAGEEVFFRGLIQGACGLFAGAVTFMIAHIGARDIRVIGYWSIFQGLGLGLLYAWTDNLLVPMLAHGLFDVGAMIHFRLFMARRLAPQESR